MIKLWFNRHGYFYFLAAIVLYLIVNSVLSVFVPEYELALALPVTFAILSLVSFYVQAETGIKEIFIIGSAYTNTVISSLIVIGLGLYEITRGHDQNHANAILVIASVLCVVVVMTAARLFCGSVFGYPEKKDSIVETTKSNNDNYR